MTGCGALRGDLAAYAVGSLDAATRGAFERHLGACGPCRRELEELRGVTRFLGALTPEEAERGPARDDGVILDRLLARVSAERRRRRRVRWVAGAAAAAVLLVAGVLGGLAVTRDGGASPQREVTTASAQGDGGVRVDLALEDRAWGTALTIQVANVSPGHTCSLVAVGADGDRETAATWTVPSGGYREEGGRRSLTVDGAVGFSVAQIDRFEVVTPEGEKLVTVALPESAPTE